MVRRIVSAAFVVGVALAVAGCGSTQMRDTWKAPDFQGGPLKNVLVVGLAKDSVNRRTFEDILVAEIREKKVLATASYTLTVDANPTEAELRDLVKQKGFDGVFVTRVVGNEVRTSYMPGTTVSAPVYGAGMYGYYGGWYATAYSPGYMVNEKIVSVETSVWSAQGDGKLIWSGVSETVDPTSVAKASQELSLLVVNTLWKAKLL